MLVTIWIISALTIAGILVCPFHTPEWVWAVAGAAALVLARLITPSGAFGALAKGTDVYLFLIGMMLLSETAREEGVFDWVATVAGRHARGSAHRLFSLMYITGTLVTVFMSNDATAVVLTPAVYQVVRKANAKPKPYLFICALIANAASFVLPISNPANLVVYGKNLPGLVEWLSHFALPSVASIAVTYVIARWWFRTELAEPVDEVVEEASLPVNGRFALAGLIATATILVACSTAHLDLGLPTFACALVILAMTSLRHLRWPRTAVRNVGWGVLPLVGGLFIVVEALSHAKVLDLLEAFFDHSASRSPALGKQMAAFGIGIATNIANNLPVGLMGGHAVQSASEHIKRAVLIGVDLGPSLSVTGSLATILWLMAIRREGQHVSGWDFFKLGLVAMPLSLAAAVALA